MRPRVGGLVLAAGAGRRYGGPKAVAELDGVRLVDRAAAVLAAGGADPVVVVLGAAVVEVPGADEVVVNPGWASGMASSLKAGLASPAFAGCTAVVVSLVDTPGVRASAVRCLADAHARGAELAVATYGGQRGHPVLLGKVHWEQIAAQTHGDQGARGYLSARPDLVVEVACDGDPRDADTPGELAGRGILSRIAGDVGPAGAPMGAGLDELSGLLGGSGARARAEEKAAEVVRRQSEESGQPPLMSVDLDAGIARFRPRQG